MPVTSKAWEKNTLSTTLLEKYNTHGPRYTSYPTAPVWSDAFGPEQYQSAIVDTNQADRDKTPLSLYVHLPFCEARCLFCSCNVVISKNKALAEEYLTYLFQEIDQVARHLRSDRPVVQFHWGGGTPTYLSVEQIERLFRFQQERFAMAPDAEIAIEIDPRVTTREQLQMLKHLGFNRISLGVQDFEAQVQETIRRIQPVGQTESMVTTCRALGFESINFDLIYGLPYQTVDSFANTLAEVIRLSPDRIALYNFAYVPWISHHQKDLPEASLPGGPQKFDIFKLALDTLLQAGYVYIGMDHFAKPDDELTLALNEGRLHRNFMGYTVQKDKQHDSDLYGFGVSAISTLDRCYAQNHKKLSTYYQAVTEGKLPVNRGYSLSQDDVIRRRVILDILCRGALDYGCIESAFGIDFHAYFPQALCALEAPQQDGLVEMTESGFVVTPLGRIFSRNLAMPFDAYLPAQAKQGQDRMFSKTL